jgi:sugar phosphate isomerase/epimerase
MLGPDIVIAHAKDSRFAENGEVAHYGAVGTGKLDYAAYVRYLKEYGRAAYLVFEYYQSREELLRARDIVSKYL